MVAAFLIVITTAVAILVPAAYFRRQRRQCRKYPFFRLRDQVILAMVHADDAEPLRESYDRVNFVIERFHRFDSPRAVVVPLQFRDNEDGNEPVR